ncbi:MAG: hypothetical protein QNJ18_13285 [Xenococcaceae cyanobacterium MO_167.B52]|nr:hypothetical protein [Xenococcaceae cyanobacterium MO_167.B52]
MEDLWQQLEKAAEEVEEFFYDLSSTMEFLAEEVGKTLGNLTQEVEEIVVGEIERCVEDLIDTIYDADFEENGIPWDEMGNLVESEFMDINTYQPSIENHPACIGCRHYHGKSYNGNLLVCAMHPYGSENNTCVDWEGLQD